MSMIDIKKPQDVSTATTVTLGLIGGWVTARETGMALVGFARADRFNLYSGTLA